MSRLPQTLKAWQTPEFKQIAKEEIESLEAKHLPLQAGLSHSSYALEDFYVMVLSAEEMAECLKLKIGVFYSGIIAGCSCADDPSPVDEQTEYCELWVSIDKSDASAHFELVPVLS
ncbi:MAG: hypothetical protein R3219_05660 [Hydrogenovibrio sp.]|nr:hypothetical protein [Hydrogenovibrio sp.]